MTDQPPDAECKLPRPRGLALNARVHWARRARDNKTDREYAKHVGELVAPQQMRQPMLEITWRGRGRLPDVDNVVGRCKAYIDGLTDAGWWRDDADIVLIRATTERVNNAKLAEEPCVVIRAWEADDRNLMR